jgi:hypothetical protein
MHDSQKHLNQAEHLMNVTYPLFGSPKILKIAMNNLYTGLKHMLKEVSGSDSKDFNVLLGKCTKVFRERKINKKFIDYLSQMHILMRKLKESEVEFSRKDRYVFASGSFELQTLSEKDVKDYILKGKLLLNLVR